MPPKAKPAAPSKKTEAKKKEKVIEASKTIWSRHSYKLLATFIALAL